MFTLGARELIIGLGSSSTDALEQLRRARARLRAHPAFRLLACSPIYESDALLPPGAPESWQGRYLNAACRLELTGELSALEIVRALKAVERDLGRREAPRWAPRLIDLDLLAWGGPAVSSAEVTVPHPGLAERPFACLPALDCAGPGRAKPSAEASAWRFAPPEQVPLRTRVASAFWPELVGILNLAPDSFSDGRAERSPAELEATVRKMAGEGATVIDVGAESTRPGASPVSPDEELRRLEPSLGTLSELRRLLGFKLSLDSRHPSTVLRVLERYPIDWLNDVGGFSEPAMVAAAKRSGCQLVAMHSMGVPPRRDAVMAPGVDPVSALLAWGESRIRELAGAGIDPGRVILDPGIGFGKTPAQNMELLARAGEMNKLGVKILIGHSRKGFLDPEALLPPEERELETAILSSRLDRAGVDYVRVHSPGLQARALRIGARLPTVA